MEPLKKTIARLNTASISKTKTNYKCDICKDTGKESIDKNTSTDCVCLLKSNIIRAVGEKFKNCTLDNFYPFNKSQKVALAEVKKNPGGSFFFCGATGSGKTHLLSALYIESYRKITRDKIVHYTDGELIKSLHDKEWARTSGLEEGHQPLALVKSIKNGKTLEMFWDDLGQINITGFTLGLWHNIINALDTSKARLVVTSNYTVDELRDPDILGASRLRRITDKCEVLEMTNEGRPQNLFDKQGRD